MDGRRDGREPAGMQAGLDGQKSTEVVEGVDEGLGGLEGRGRGAGGESGDLGEDLKRSGCLAKCPASSVRKGSIKAVFL